MSLRPDSLLPELGIPWTVSVNARARRLRLSINERGARLTLPPGVDPQTARRFVESQREWLRRHWAPLAPIAAAHSAGLALDGSETLMLRGRSFTLQLSASAAPRVVQNDGAIEVSGVDAQGTGRKRLHTMLKQWLTSQARADAQRYIQEHGKDLGWPQSLRLRTLSSLWGSLSPRGVMSLDLALIGAPPTVFEYVVVHELAHLRERNHSPRFWTLVARRLPDWPEKRRWLRSNGSALKMQWRRIAAPLPGC